MRVIEVTESDVFTSLYEGWLASTADLRGLGNLRTGAKVLDALEVISTPAGPEPCEKCGTPNLRSRRLVEGGGSLWLEEAEWQMLKSSLASVSWRPAGARAGVKALELVENPQQVTAKEAAA